MRLIENEPGFLLLSLYLRYWAISFPEDRLFETVIRSIAYRSCSSFHWDMSLWRIDSRVILYVHRFF